MMKYAEIHNDTIKFVSETFGTEADLSFAVPDIIGEERVERFFLYPINLSAERERPFAHFFVSSTDGKRSEIKQCSVEDFVDSKKYPLDMIISYRFPENVKALDLLKQIELVNEIYEEVRTFTFSEALIEEQLETLIRYFELFIKSVPKSLMPYYRSLGANFFKWGYDFIAKKKCDDAKNKL